MMSLKKLELLIPPPLVALFFLNLSWLAGTYWLLIDGWLLVNGLAINIWLTYFLGGIGAIFLIVANVMFHRAGTTFEPRHPDQASKLVTHGIFRLSRNPMYVGMFLILLAMGFWFSSWIALLLPWLFLLYMNHFQIMPEERILQKKFGKNYNNYCKSVRRWL